MEGGKADVVISDMAPNLSGVAMVDAGASLLLNELALEFAEKNLKPEGVFVTKVFRARATRSLWKAASASLRR